MSDSKTFHPPPIIEQIFYVDGEPIVFFYELTNKKRYREHVKDDMKIDHHLLSTVMDRMEWWIDDDMKAANRAYFTPLRKYLKRMWFVYWVKGNRGKTNAEFKKKYSDTTSEFAKNHKYGEEAQEALVSLMIESVKLANESDTRWKDARSLEWAVNQLTDGKDYIELARQRIAVKAHTNGS